jgi:hypothetical protein
MKILSTKEDKRLQKTVQIRRKKKKQQLMDNLFLNTDLIFASNKHKEVIEAIENTIANGPTNPLRNKGTVLAFPHARTIPLSYPCHIEQKALDPQ